MIKEAYGKAIEVLEACSTPYGFYASGGPKGYTAVWARDSMISSIGASLVGEKFKEVFRKSLLTLAEHQGKNGQIPNCIDKWSERKPHVDFKSIDSSLWFIVGYYVYLNRYKEKSLKEKLKKNVESAFAWLRCQDWGENGLLAQHPTSDWQDAFPHRYGYTINTHALYYFVLKLAGEKNLAEKIKKIINEDKNDGLWGESYYYSYRWKNHNKYKELGDWFDSLGNVLSIVFGLADEKKAERILKYVREKKVAEPYPMRCIFPTIDKKSEYWQDYYLDCLAGTSNSYLNGGIWGYIGCYYVLALIKQKKFDEARKQLEKIAKANLKWGFPEWITPSKKPVEDLNKMQCWEAGSFVLACKSLDKRKILILN